MDSKKLNYREFVKDDCEHRIRDLYKVVWKTESPSAAFWEWKYFKSPFGSLGLVLENQEREIVAFCGFWRRNANVGKDKVSTLALLDVMAHPDYRKGAAFPILLQKIDKLVKTEMMYGFTNVASMLSVTNNLQHNQPLVDKVPVLSSVINLGSIKKIPLPLKSTLDSFSRMLHGLRHLKQSHKHITVSQDNSFGSEVESLWLKTSKDYFYILDRTPAYFEWRYSQDPTKTYQIWRGVENGECVGLMVSHIGERFGKKVGLLMDWLIPRERIDVFEKMLQTVLKWMIDARVDQVDTWCMKHEKHWMGLFKKYFFVQNRKKPFTFGGGPDWYGESCKSNREYFNTTENLFFTIGDSDFFGEASMVEAR